MEAVDQSKGSRSNILERKWTSIVKLTKQKMDLEKQIKILKEEGTQVLDNVFGKSSNTDQLPREPAKYNMQGHRAKVTKIAIHPHYSIVASASEDASIRLWEFDQGEHERTMKGHTGMINFITFNSNGSLLASCSSDLSIKIWSMETGQATKTLNGHEHEVSGLSFLPNEDFLLSCSRDQTIKFWDIQSGFCLQTLSQGHSDWIKRISVSPSGKLFASSSKDESIVVWNCELVKQKSTMGTGGGGSTNDPDYAIVQVLSEHEHVIDCIAWAPSEANKIIELAPYNNGMVGDQNNQETEDGAEGEENGRQSTVGIDDMDGSTPSGAAAAAADNNDDTRANLNTRMTTKERI